ncbi:MAG TPA: hypothetical protein VGO89_01120 [Streptomyces sp.]|nr:hypothetical protein [Streptomyces sp.]
MRWLALEAGDAATWGSTVVTFGMACYAIAQGLGQRRELRRQNELQAETSQLQRRQIETAERRTLVMEQILAELTVASARNAPPPPKPSLPPDGHPPLPPPPPTYGGMPEPVHVPDLPRAGHGSVGSAPPPAQRQRPGVPQVTGRIQGTWRLERFGEHGYALRNIGSETLTGVHVSRANLPSSARGVPESAVVRAGETAEFLMAPARGRPVPTRVRVSWHGQLAEVDVPVTES